MTLYFSFKCVCLFIYKFVEPQGKMNYNNECNFIFRD